MHCQDHGQFANSGGFISMISGRYGAPDANSGRIIAS
jgi:hypothetical protein